MAKGRGSGSLGFPNLGKSGHRLTELQSAVGWEFKDCLIP